MTEFDKVAGYKLQLTLGHSKCPPPDKHLWKVRLSVSFGKGDSDKSPRYEGHATVEGLFEVHPKYPEQEIVSLVRMNGGAILMGAIREAVLTQTARSAHGPLELPTIDATMFTELPEESPEEASSAIPTEN